MPDLLNDEFTRARAELHALVSRLVLRPAVAEEVVQTTWVRCREAVDRLPTSADGVRAWLFTVATRLALDERKRHSSWKEDALVELKTVALGTPDFMERSRALAGTPETKAVAREHLSACVACTLRSLPEQKAAALLLREVHGFSNDELATMLDATPTQVKNWLQDARLYLTTRYEQTCALVNKQGVCHQCVELDGFFGAHAGTPLPKQTDVDARLEVLRAFRARPWGAWHTLMFGLLDELE